MRRSATTAAVLATGYRAAPMPAAGKGRKSAGKVIVIGVDGMDPKLSQHMMEVGSLPNFASLRNRGGYRVLGTSMPPQSPVAWANFINGAGPGSHGIFDFIHRDPQEQCAPFFAAAETVPGSGYVLWGDAKLQLTFFPFNHRPAKTVLRRQGVPFWDYLDQAGIASVFYDLPSNYPPSPSKHGHHRCLAGMGTPDLLGSYGTYQYFCEDGPAKVKEIDGGIHAGLSFEKETAETVLTGPMNTLLRKPLPATIGLAIHRDKQAGAALVEIQGKRILLKQGQWSRWIQLDFPLSTPTVIPDQHVRGICRFYLQQVTPQLCLYVSPINTDPSKPALTVTEPPGFIKDISSRLGMFYTTGFQEDHKALSNKVFTEDEYIVQAGMVLEDRLRLLDYAVEHYDEGLLFFYFSSTDLQAHMFWWDPNKLHPTRSPEKVEYCINHLKSIYARMDGVLGEILKRYGNKATIIVMSDHGFASFGRQFDLNGWLRENGYISPADATSLLHDVDWSKTKAYGMGINGLYLNLLGRERDGIVVRGREQEELMNELVARLEAVTDVNGQRVIHRVHRTDQTCSGPAMGLAPDLLIGYRRGYRASWGTCLGNIGQETLSDNLSAWSADHCADMSQVPGVIFSNRPISAETPSLVDIAPSILTEFGLKVPGSMQGRDIFGT